MRLTSYLNESASNTTRLQEGLHCLVFAAKMKRKNKGVDLYDDVDFLEKIYNKHISCDAPFAELYDFAINKEKWAQSIINAANILLKSGLLKSGSYTYHRNDAFMTSIYQQAQILLKKEGAKLNNDKWNPSDIWVGKINSIPSFDSIGEYNDFISKSLANSKLVGISLKMVGSSPKIEYISGDTPQTPQHFGGVKKPTVIFPTGISIKNKDFSGAVINIRSPRTSVEQPITGEITIRGSKSRHGKVPIDKIRATVKKYNIPHTSKTVLVKKTDEELKNMVVDLWNQCGYNFTPKDVEAGWQKKIQKEIRTRAGYWQSVIQSLQIGAWMTANKSISHDIFNTWWWTAKSVGGYSSNFIKIYD